MNNLLSCVEGSAYYYTIISIREGEGSIAQSFRLQRGVGTSKKLCNIFKLIFLCDFELSLLKSH